MSNLSSAAASRRESVRAADGTFGHQQHTEPNVSLSGPDQVLGSSVVRATVADRVGGFLDAEQISAIVPDVQEALNATGRLSDDAVDAAISHAARSGLGHDPIVARDLAHASGGAELDPMSAQRIADYVRELETDRAKAHLAGESEPAARPLAAAPSPADVAVAQAKLKAEAVREANLKMGDFSLYADNYGDGPVKVAVHDGWKSKKPNPTVEKWLDEYAANLEHNALPSGTAEDPAPYTDPRVQAGEVFDTVDFGGTSFHRRREGVHPSGPYALRIQANRPLGDTDMQNLAGMAGYAMMTAGRGEGMSDPLRDSPYSFVVHNDTTKGGQYRNLERFEENLAEYLAGGGTPARTSDRAGVGTKGTRALDSSLDPDTKIEIYYDQVDLY